ncbi:MAG TPA: peptidylprolyl isomerase [Pyrinomonadaceae bacterium]|nr:peptidylprolyl isomerase [Pyrinomonadaceae bacterium]
MLLPANFALRAHLRAGRLRSQYLVALAILAVLSLATIILAQDPQPSPKPDAAKKANARPNDPNVEKPDPFDGASAEKMAAQCVNLETELGIISLEMMPDVAPESVRSFLNMVGTGSLDTTTFSRTVKDFVIQGGNLSTSERWGYGLAKRASRKLPDEPSVIKHVRGIVSMARPDEPNSATTHFFILVGDGHHLDGKFSAFGRVTKGLEVADEINKAPAEGEKPNKPVRINRAVIVPCVK